MTNEQRKFLLAQRLIVRPWTCEIYDWRLFGLSEYWWREPGWEYKIERACEAYLDDILSNEDYGTSGL
jgi:hypothetical protein